MSDLPPGVERFGEDLKRSAAREIEERRKESAPRRRWRGLGLPVVAALLAAAVSAGAVTLVDGGTGEPIEAERGDSSATLQAPKDPAVVPATAAEDPGGGPPWVVRAFTNPAGQECVQIGRLRNGVFGEVQGGRFRRLPASAPGTCAVPGAPGPLIAARRTGADRTLVFGLGVDRAPVSIGVGDRRQSVRPAGLGAFVAVFAGAERDDQIVVRSRVGGRTSVVRR